MLRLDKIESTGKVIFQKNLIDKFYKFLSIHALSVVDNGFILSAYADTTSTNGTQYLHYLTKFLRFANNQKRKKQLVFFNTFSYCFDKLNLSFNYLFCKK